MKIESWEQLREWARSRFEMSASRREKDRYLGMVAGIDYAIEVAEKGEIDLPATRHEPVRLDGKDWRRDAVNKGGAE